MYYEKLVPKVLGELKKKKGKCRAAQRLANAGSHSHLVSVLFGDPGQWRESYSTGEQAVQRELAQQGDVTPKGRWESFSPSPARACLPLS